MKQLNEHFKTDCTLGYVKCTINLNLFFWEFTFDSFFFNTYTLFCSIHNLYFWLLQYFTFQVLFLLALFISVFSFFHVPLDFTWKGRNYSESVLKKGGIFFAEVCSFNFVHSNIILSGYQYTTSALPLCFFWEFYFGLEYLGKNWPLCFIFLSLIFICWFMIMKKVVIIL